MVHVIEVTNCHAVESFPVVTRSHVGFCARICSFYRLTGRFGEALDGHSRLINQGYAILVRHDIRLHEYFCGLFGLSIDNAWEGVSKAGSLSVGHLEIGVLGGGLLAEILTVEGMADRVCLTESLIPSVVPVLGSQIFFASGSLRLLFREPLRLVKRAPCIKSTIIGVAPFANMQ